MRKHATFGVPALAGWLLLVAFGVWGELPNVIPAPRQMVPGPGSLAWDKIECFVERKDCGMEGGIEQVNARLAELGVKALPVKDSSKGIAIRIAVADEVGWGSMGGDAPEQRPEAYRLIVSQEGVYITGKDRPGLYHGLMTLRQLASEKGLPCVDISDWPDQRLRGTYMAGYADYEKRIAAFAALKLNMVLFEDVSLFELDKPEVRDRWQQIFALCRKHYIEPVPELQSFGWGQYVLQVEPQAVEGAVVDKRSFDVADGKVQSPDAPIPPSLKIVNAGFEEGEGNQITGWLQDPPGTGAAIEREGAHAGKGCCRITRTDAGTMRVWQDAVCPTSQFYEVSCYLKTKDIVKGYAYIEVYGVLPDGKLGDLIGRDAAKLTGTHDWQRTAARFNTDKYTHLQIYIRLQEGIGTAWFDDVAVTGLKAPNPLGNVIVTKTSPVLVQNADGTVAYEEGKDFTVAAPGIKFPYLPSAPLEIVLLPGSRIKNGDKVLLTYNYAPEGSITCCPSEPLYQEFMRKAVHNAINYLKPKYLHIGHDEPRLMCRDKRCLDRKLTSGEIFVDDIKRMREYALEADPAIRVMMWSDAVNPYQNGPMLHMETAAETIPRDIIQCLWWYEERDYEKLIEQSTQYFLGLGFDITGSPWFDPRNAHRWAETLYRHGKDNAHVLGIIYTSWAHDFEDPWKALPTAAEYSWTIDKPPFDPAGK